MSVRKFCPLDFHVSEIFALAHPELVEAQAAVELRRIGDERVILAFLAAQIESVLFAERTEANDGRIIQFAAYPLRAKPACLDAREDHLESHREQPLQQLDAVSSPQRSHRIHADGPAALANPVRIAGHFGDIARYDGVDTHRFLQPTQAGFVAFAKRLAHRPQKVRQCQRFRLQFHERERMRQEVGFGRSERHQAADATTVEQGFVQSQRGILAAGPEHGSVWGGVIHGSRGGRYGPFGIYTLFQRQGQDVAGMMNPTGASPAREPHWQAYIAVSDVDACALRVPELGGKVVVPPHDVPEFGRVCQISDPTGALICLVTTLV